MDHKMICLHPSPVDVVAYSWDELRQNHNLFPQRFVIGRQRGHIVVTPTVSLDVGMERVIITHSIPVRDTGM